MTTTIQVLHVSSKTVTDLDEIALERAVECNGPHDGCVALMPEDWPEGFGEFDDASNIWMPVNVQHL